MATIGACRELCSINGCLIFEGEREGRKKNRNQDEIRAIEDRLRRLILRGEERGRDSYGIVALQRDGKVIEIREAGRPSHSLHLKPAFINGDTIIVLNNNRAEPTTEYVPLKDLKDIQPFGSSVFVTHNGIIANDAELESQYELRRSSRIDSAILPPLLEGHWDGSFEGLKKILMQEVMGSFALAVARKEEPSTLYLACNYKPLFLEYDLSLDVLFFTSLEQYLQQDTKPLWEANPVRQVDPYSMMSVNAKKEYRKTSLWQDDCYDDRKMRRALVVFSAGLDSTTASKFVVDKGYEVTLLHISYGQRAEAREAEQARKIAKSLTCGFINLDTEIFKRFIRNSRLTSTLDEVVKDRGGEAGAEFAHEWVPARNLIFLSIATAMAEAYGYDLLVLGNNLEEGGVFPDNEQIFIHKLNEVLPYATNVNKRVRIEMPVGNLMKHEIVKLGVAIGAPLHLTWSCYEGGEKHCGKCGPCYMRRKAFEMNGLKDVVEYSELSRIFAPASEAR